jgi:hypothetical protein
MYAVVMTTTRIGDLTEGGSTPSIKVYLHGSKKIATKYLEQRFQKERKQLINSKNKTLINSGILANNVWASLEYDDWIYRCNYGYQFTRTEFNIVSCKDIIPMSEDHLIVE